MLNELSIWLNFPKEKKWKYKMIMTLMYIFFGIYIVCIDLKVGEFVLTQRNNSTE